MPEYVQIAVNMPGVSARSDGVFDYHLPPELEGRVQPGHLVTVPFARQIVQGIVLQMIAQPSVSQTRAVLDLLDPLPALTGAQIALAKQISHDTISPLAVVIQLMLPPGLSKQADTLYTLSERLPPGGLPAAQQRLLGLLQQRGALRGRQIDSALPRKNWRSAAQALLRKELLQAQPILPEPSARPKQARTVSLACSRETAQAALDDLGRKGTPALQRRQAVLQFLIQENQPVEAAWVYASSGGKLDDLHYLEARGLVILGEAETWRDPLAALAFTPTGAPPLTQDQQHAWAEVQAALEAAYHGQAVPPILLHGVTGSGKTEIYLHAAAHALRQGRQAIILVPEIAMTPQTVQRFLARFPGQVGLLHSRLSDGERYDTWRRARAGKLEIMVGPRSALFTPFPNLGLIVVDECHDDAYYQADVPPRYHARPAAVAYAQLAGAVCLLGSATPDLESRFRAAQGQWRYISLPARILAHRQSVQHQLEKLAQAGAGAGGHYRPVGGADALAEMAELPAVQVVDMRQELKAGNRSIFSRALQESLAQVLQAGEQAILFLNRRGSATYVFCRACGYTLKCPRCDSPLTYHIDASGSQLSGAASGPPVLLCHRCSYKRGLPKTCPQCGSPHIRHYGTGTERVEEEVHKLFSGDLHPRTLRWDYETTRQKGAHEAILQQFSERQADILVGTQMIAKGLDLPFVTLVGIILADVGLALPDLRAGERTFHLLTQVAGRAGRSPLGGRAILQTFDPDNYVIQAAAQHDYHGFYQKELALRRQMVYPPYARLLRLEVRHADATHAEASAQAMGTQIRSWLAALGDRQTELIGPAPCFFARMDNQFRWQILLRGPDPAGSLRGYLATGLAPEWRIEVDPPSLL